MMKQLSFCLLLVAVATTAQAQDTYLNDRATNTSDVIGTARYVGMGGAMGALGADISVISNNPAGIGLMRKGSFSFTLGGQIQDAPPADGDSRGAFSFDQIGFVLPMSTFVDNGSRVNFAFNYQKKANYNQGILAAQPLNGISQADMFAWIANTIVKSDAKGYYFDSPFYDNLYTAGFFKEHTNANGDTYFRNTSRSQTGYYYRSSSGSLQGFDFNVSGAVQDRYYWGLTIGIDHMIYKQDASYEENCLDPDASYILYQNQELKGCGFNFKGGVIIRPIEENPLRFGLTVETPSWYMLKHTALAGLSVVKDGRYTSPSYMNDDNYLEYNIYSPWKFRASIGSTYDRFFAWDVEYEYSMNNFTKMGYPDNFSNNYNSSVSMTKDRAMNQMTKNNIRGVHNFRAGFEVKPVSGFAVRGGYNFFSSPYKKNARLDQTCDSPAFDWSTSTDYVNLGATHLITVGLGFQGKHFFADLAYKYRYQRGDFFAFDDNFTSYNESFINENPALRDVQLRATEVNLDRHNIAVTLGYKF